MVLDIDPKVAKSCPKTVYKLAKNNGQKLVKKWANMLKLVQKWSKSGLELIPKLQIK